MTDVLEIIRINIDSKWFVLVLASNKSDRAGEGNVLQRGGNGTYSFN